MATVDEVRTLLTSGSFSIKSEKAMSDGRGMQLRLANEAVVNVFNTGKVQVQGKNTGPVRACLGLELETHDDEAGVDRTALNKVFVVYGHDQTCRTALEAMLRRWQLDPLILDQLPSEGQTLIEKLEKYTTDVRFAVILATPDDMGYRIGHEDERQYRARQNVVLELGMMLTRLGRKNVAILLKDQDGMERPSDIQGLIYIPFKDDLAKEAGLLLAKEMIAQGYSISLKDL